MDKTETRTPLDMMIAIAKAKDTEELDTLQALCLARANQANYQLDRLPLKWWRARGKLHKRIQMWNAVQTLIALERLSDE